MIHKYTLNGYNIVIDVNSGSVHVLDNLSFDMLDYMDKDSSSICPDNIYSAFSANTRDEITETYSELIKLISEGLLFSDEVYIENLEKYTHNAPVKAMCLHIAHDCNLKCEYCFASKGDFGTGKKLMSYEVGKAAIDFVIKNSGKRRNIEIDFFGGEPLMNFETVKRIVEYARSKEEENNKKFRFTITTNGVLLTDEIIDYINKEMSNVVLSLDGRKEVNDKMRKTVNDLGSFDVILPKFKNLAKKRNYENYYLRGTFTGYNLDFAEDVKFIASEGFDQISVEPVVCDEQLPYALKEEHIEAICNEYEKLAQYIIELKKNKNPINFFHFMIDLENGPCAIKRTKGCGCGGEYIAITPEGDIYPCHQFVGNDKFKMGSVLDGSIDADMKAEFEKSNVENKPECKKCWAKYYCSGGCNANNYNFNNNIKIPYKISCELEKKRVECAIMIKAALSDIEG